MKQINNGSAECLTPEADVCPSLKRNAVSRHIYYRRRNRRGVYMRKKREFVEGAVYHVTSRNNSKIKVFENRLGRKIMLIVLQDAKDKFRFRLANFCVMPTHIHLLIEPGEGTNLAVIMGWIKTRTAKWWNKIHGSKDHMWMLN